MGKFRINTIAFAKHDIDKSAQTDGLAHGRMKRNGVTQGKPKDRRQACKGPKRAPRPMFDRAA